MQTVVAEPWFKVSDEGLVLEGPAFDRDGNLLFCDVSGRRVLRLTPDRRLSTIVSLDGLGPGGLAVHKDGRVFIAAMDLAKGVGSVLAVEPDGSGMQVIVPPEAGYMPNDLVFDARGGFYFTDFRGASTDPKGGVYYVSPDFGTTTPVLPRLAMANGIALSPDGKELWATEFSGNLLQDRTGVPQDRLSDIEAGQIDPPLDMMVALASVVGCDLWTLLTPPPGGAELSRRSSAVPAPRRR